MEVELSFRVKIIYKETGSITNTGIDQMRSHLHGALYPGIIEDVKELYNGINELHIECTPSEVSIKCK